MTTVPADDAAPRRLRRPGAQPRRGPRARRAGRVAGRLGPRPHARPRAAAGGDGARPSARRAPDRDVPPRRGEDGGARRDPARGRRRDRLDRQPVDDRRRRRGRDDGPSRPPDLRPQGGRHGGPPRAHRTRARERPGHAAGQRRGPDRRDGGGRRFAGLRRDRGDDLGPPPPDRGAGRPRPVPRHRDQRLADQALVRERAGHRPGHRRRVLPRDEHVRRRQDVRGRRASAGAGAASPGRCVPWARSCSSWRSTRCGRSRRPTRGCWSRRSRRPRLARTR